MRWGQILAGLFTAITIQLVLSVGAVIGLSSIANLGALRSDAGEIHDICHDSVPLFHF